MRDYSTTAAKAATIVHHNIQRSGLTILVFQWHKNIILDYKKNYYIWYFF